jgi:hypothetical protein
MYYFGSSSTEMLEEAFPGYHAKNEMADHL